MYLEHFLRVSEKTLSDPSVDLCVSKKEALPGEVWRVLTIPNQSLPKKVTDDILKTIMKCGNIFLLEDILAYLPMVPRYRQEIKEAGQKAAQFRNKFLSSLPPEIQTALALARQEMIEFMKKYYGWVKQPPLSNTRF